MLEILGIIMLCNKNRANALERGRNPSGFVALTVGLWLGLELIGAMIGTAMGMELGAYGLGILFAAIGAVTSYLVAKNCSPGSDVPPARQIGQAVMQNAQPLITPVQIFLVRESSVVGSLVRWDFTLNGQPTGSLSNGSNITVATMQRRNVLQARDAYGTEIAPFVFDVAEGTAAEIHFKGNKFLPDQSRGCLMLGVQNPEIPQAAFCPGCGTQLIEGASFCTNCGEKRYDSVIPDGPAGIYARPSQFPYHTSAVQAAAVAQPPNPVRAVWAAGMVLFAWLLLYLFQGIFRGRLLYNGEAVRFLVDGLLGVGVFLICQKDILQKCLGAAAGVISALLYAFTSHAAQFQSRSYGNFSLFELLDFTSPYVWEQFLRKLICVGLMLGAAFSVAYWLRNRDEKQRLLASGGITAGIFLLFHVIYTVSANPMFFSINRYLIFTILLGFVADMAIIFLAVIFLQKLCTIPQTSVRLRGIGLAWAWIAAVGMLGSLILIILQGTGISAGMAYTSGFLLAIAGLTGYILLLCKKRFGLYVLLAGAGLMLGGQFFGTLMPVLNGMSHYASLFFGSILGAVNPLLGYLAVRAADRQPPAAQVMGYGIPVPRKVSGFDKFTAVFIIVSGGIFFLFPVPFLVMGEPFVEGMAICMAIGMCIAGFGVICAVMQRSKTTVYPLGMKVVSIIIWSVCALCILIICIGLLTSL